MDPLPRGLLGLRRRYLFTLYLLVGSLSIVLAVDGVHVAHRPQSVEDQSRLTTQLLSGVASRLLLTGDIARGLQRSSTSSTRSRSRSS